VAHFQVEYQDEIGRTELIENITTLKAERDRAQADAIAMTSWANALAAEYAEAHTQWAEDVTIYNARIAELEAQVAWSAARIAELEGAKK
jgi:hypothetical protein